MEKNIKKEVMRYFNNKLDVIISDMAADTTGSKSLDSIRTNQLCADAICFSKEILKPRGVFVSKLFDFGLRVGDCVFESFLLTFYFSKGASSSFYLLSSYGFVPTFMKAGN